jgi:SAM-dependent methyltransferase
MGNGGINSIVRDVTPPVVMRAIDRSRARRVADTRTSVLSHEAGPEFYDGTFEAKDHWRVHYSNSPWYYIWTVLTDRLTSGDDPAVLDIGCGSGQLAKMLSDRGVRSYVGFDFSPKRIEWARDQVPEFTFVEADAHKTDLFDEGDYDSVVCTEFLEHVDGDVEVVARIRSGTRFLGTVPDFGGGSHVRFFRSAEEVEDRYASAFREFKVDTFFMPGGRSRQFLIDGVIGP